MIKSMTGYGRGEFTDEAIKYVVELRSINSKYLDLTFRIPNHLQFFEMELRDVIKKRVQRGKVIVNISETTSNGVPLLLDLSKNDIQLMANKLREISEIAQINEPIELRDLLFYTDRLINQNQDEHQKKLTFISHALTLALDNLELMRFAEGEAILSQLKNEIKKIQLDLFEIKKLSPIQFDLHQKRLLERLSVIGLTSEEIDQTRLVQEIALLLDKQDIQEEIVRLESHLNQFEMTLNDNQPIGKKLNFLLQEFHREVNTIASKSSDIGIIKKTISMRDSIEMVREQAQNVE